MKKIYENPELVVVDFETKDVITTSGDIWGGDSDGDNLT